MRLIDADNIDYESIDSSDTSRHEYYYGTGIMAVRKEDIDAMPTIEERKTGKWIGKYPVTSACSECNYLIHDSKVKVFAYCPNCGAKMEG